MADCATTRTKTHLSHLDTLSHEIRTGGIDPIRLSQLEDRNNIFLEIEYSVFSR
jgi:predicted glycosyl hydrolase (DUF1957 family)